MNDPVKKNKIANGQCTDTGGFCNSTTLCNVSKWKPACYKKHIHPVSGNVHWQTVSWEIGDCACRSAPHANPVIQPPPATW